MSTATAHDHPLVWDSPDLDTFMGMDGHGHTVECAQQHVDHAMEHEWGVHDCRFVVEQVAEREPMVDPVNDVELGPWTQVLGEYQALTERP